MEFKTCEKDGLYGYSSVPRMDDPLALSRHMDYPQAKDLMFEGLLHILEDTNNSWCQGRDVSNNSVWLWTLLVVYTWHKLTVV